MCDTSLMCPCSLYSSRSLISNHFNNFMVNINTIFLNFKFLDSIVYKVHYGRYKCSSKYMVGILLLTSVLLGGVDLECFQPISRWKRRTVSWNSVWLGSRFFQPSIILSILIVWAVLFLFLKLIISFHLDGKNLPVNAARTRASIATNVVAVSDEVGGGWIDPNLVRRECINTNLKTDFPNVLPALSLAEMFSDGHSRAIFERRRSEYHIDIGAWEQGWNALKWIY